VSNSLCYGGRCNLDCFEGFSVSIKLIFLLLFRHLISHSKRWSSCGVVYCSWLRGEALAVYAAVAEGSWVVTEQWYRNEEVHNMIFHGNEHVSR